MRTTMLVVLCSFASGCAPLSNGGEPYSGDGPDAGLDGAAAGPCDDLETLTMNISIAGASGFNNLPTGCWALNGTLTIAGPAVTSVAKLGDLRSVTHLEINNTDLTTFDSKSPVEVTGDLWIRYNDKLTDITKVVTEGTVQSIAIQNNPALVNLGGATRATKVAGQTTIDNNLALKTIAFPNAQRLEKGLYIGDTGATSIDIAKLQSVSSLTIKNNAELTTLVAPTNLTNVHASLEIANNVKLRSLGQLGDKTVITSSLIVTGNGQLADLGQLSHAGSIGIVQISSNGSLPHTKIHDIGCCVTTGSFTATLNQDTDCAGGHWCLNAHNCYR